MKITQLQAKINAIQKILNDLSGELLSLSAPTVQPEPPKPKAPELKPEEMLSAYEAQKILKISPATFYLWIKAGILPEGTRLSRKTRRWKRSEIENIEFYETV